MFKNWKTSLFGLLAGSAQLSAVLSGAGIHAGHFGGGDIIGLVGAVATTVLGFAAKDHNGQ